MMHAPRLIFPLLLLFGVGMASCGSNQQGFRHPFLKQVHEQIAMSCDATDALYFKYVRDLSPEGSLPEDSTFALNDSCKLLVDLQYAYEQTFLEPGIQDYYDVSHHGDTLMATVIPGKEDKAGLLSQKILFSLPDSTIRYIGLVINKDQFLYELNATLEIAFDSLGRYERHQQVVKVHVFGGDTYFAETLGKIRYP
ncbi:MAG: hypothetical protein NWR72_18955 [Bacteroidia bacterium]|nr:hypothetical protein [Bacteroidia bacterium]